MRPHLVNALSRIFGRDVALALAPTYFTFAALAMMAGVLVVARRARRDGDDVRVVLRAVGIGYVAALAGGIISPMIAAMRFGWAGMVAYGGFVFGLGGAALALRGTTVTFARFADLCAAPLGLAVAIVRVGCFVAGCDYGKVTALPWGVRFPAGSSAWVDHVASGLVPMSRATSLPVHPTQLYEALLGLALFAGATLVMRRKLRAGATFVATAAAYAIGRAAIETLRGDASRGFIGPFSTSQLISALVLVACAAAVLRARVRTIAAAATVVAMLAFAPDASAQAQPVNPYQDPPPPQPQNPYPPYPTQPPPPQMVGAAPSAGFDAGALVGISASLNRRSGQIPPLAAFSLYGGWAMRYGFGIGAHLEMATNSTATHTTLGFMGFYRVATGLRNFAIHGRFGVGGTWVNFRDQSFAASGGFDWRMAGALEWRVAERFSVLVQPLALDILYSSGLGGYVITYQFQVGVAFGPP